MADLFGTYSKRIKLTIDNTKVDAALSWFPVTVFFTDAQAEEIFSELAVADYMKCAFTKADGVTELYAEKELFSLSDYYADFLIGGTASADIEGIAASNAVDDSLATRWSTTSAAFPHWWKYDSGAGITKTVRKLRLNKYWNASGSAVKNFTLQGSNNDSDWDTIYTGVAADEGVDNIWEEFTFSNSTAYRYHKINITTSYRGDGWCAIHEIEMAEAGPKAIYHVSKDGWEISDSADTDFYFYYDSLADDNTDYIGAIDSTPGYEVWDDSFKLVWHMKDDTTSTVKDSTSNGNDGTKQSANNPLEITGKVGQGQFFDGSDYISKASFLNTAPLTVSCIVRLTKDDAWIANKRDAAGDDQWQLRHYNNAIGVSVLDGTSNVAAVTDGDNIVNAGYKHVGFTTTGVTDGPLTLYLNGASHGTPATLTGNMKLGSRAVVMGIRSWDLTNGPLKEMMDEVRISNATRSAAWMKATYNSLWDTLLTYGDEESAGWTGKICGVTNPSKICGVPTSAVEAV